MRKEGLHQCQCFNCQSSRPYADQVLHQQFNLLLSRMNEQERRWWAAHEANRLGYGSIRQVALISGLAEKTISKGQLELARSLEGRPTKSEGVRVAGGGRKPAEKRASVNRFARIRSSPRYGGQSSNQSEMV